MKFLLETNGGSWPDCTPEELDNAVLAMLADWEEFAVLAPEKPVGALNIRFMQAARYPEGVRVEFSLRIGGQWRIYFRHYGEGSRVLQLFEDFYAAGLAPDFDEYELDPKIFPD